MDKNHPGRDGVLRLPRRLARRAGPGTAFHRGREPSLTCALPGNGRPRATVDYARVFELTRSTAVGRPLRLIESVRGHCCCCPGKFSGGGRGSGSGSKPRAPVPGHFTWMAVEIRRTR